MTILAGALFEIVRFFLALPFWCAVLQIANGTFAQKQTDYVIPPSPNVWNPLHYVAAAGDQTIAVSLAYPSHEDHAFHREIRSGGGEPLRVPIPLGSRASWLVHGWSDALVIDGTDWWYATLDDRDDAPAITFIKSDGARTTYAKPPALRAGGAEEHAFPISPLPGEKPRVIGFNFKTDETVAVEMGLDGVKRSWRLPAVDFSKFVGRVIAEPLPDGRIALVDNHNARINMFLLSDDGQFESASLRDVEARELDACLDSSARLVIAIRRKDTGAIESAVVDPAHPGAAQWRTLSRDVQLLPLDGGLRVVPGNEGYTVAWMNDAGGRRLEAAAVDGSGQSGPVVEIGRPYSRGEPFFTLQARHDDLLFWWDDDGHVIARRLPASLNGYAVMTELRCDDSKQSRDPLKSDGLLGLIPHLWDINSPPYWRE